MQFNKIKKNYKRVFSFIMVIVLVFQIFSILLVPVKSEASSKATLTFVPYKTRDGKELSIYVIGTTADGGIYEHFNRRSFRLDGRVAFCIEHGLPAHDDTIYNVSEANNFNFDYGKSSEEELSKIIYHGYMKHVNSTTNIIGRYEAATQFLIWEAMGSNFTDTNALDNASLKQKYGVSTPIQVYREWKKEVMNDVKNHSVIPSFNNQTIKLNLGESITLTDTNGVLGEFKESSNYNDKGLKVSRSGNKITIKAEQAVEKTTLRYQKFEDRFTTKNNPSLIYHLDGEQTIGEYYLPDPVYTVLNVEVNPYGKLEVRKVDDENNTPLRNAEFQLLNSSGTVVKSGKTNSSGVLEFTDIFEGQYTLKEITAPQNYVIKNVSSNISIKSGNTTKITVGNKRVKGKATIVKQDTETGNNAQGKGSLAGAVYGLYKEDGTKIGEVATKDINGKAQGTIDNLELGKYYWKELQAPYGYNLDSNTKHEFQLIYQGQNVEVVTETDTALNDVIKGRINGHKLGNKPLVGDVGDIKPPLENIELTATSKTTAKKYATKTDKLGYFEINNLPFDDYVLTETKGKEGYKIINPIDFSISEQGQSLHYLLEDKVIEQRIRIVKYDKETGETIALANTQFKIWDKELNGYLKMRIPNDTEYTDIFSTNDKGYLVTSDTLKYGVNRYEVHEIRSPQNYTLGENIVFSVTDDTDDTQTIYFGNESAKKDIELFKYEEFNDKKTPLQGVTFTLYNINGEELGQYTTDENGKITVKGLKAGEYYFLENEPLESFFPNDKLHKFEVDFGENGDGHGEMMLKSVENELMPAELRTKALNKDDSLSIVDPLENITIEDTVSYNNLFAGKEYSIKGVLMDKATKSPLLVDGEEVRSEITFTPESGSGTVKLEFNINASKLHGKTIVVFENLYRDGILVGSHEDIEDKEQTIIVTNPELGTLATYEDGFKSIDPLGIAKMKDTVGLLGLIPEKSYKLEAVLIDKSTGKPLLVNSMIDDKIEDEEIEETTELDIEEVVETEETEIDIEDDADTTETELIEVRNTAEFIADKEDMRVEVPFEFDVEDLRGKEIVVFEKLFRLNSDGEYEEIANHEDIEDEGQTVKVSDPELGTLATFKDGLKVHDPLDVVEIIDTVKLTGLVPSKTYRLDGVLMDKATNNPLLAKLTEAEIINEESLEELEEDLVGSEEVDEGEDLHESDEAETDILEPEKSDDNNLSKVTNSITFIAEEENMTIDLPFSFKASSVRGKELVVFEKLYGTNPDGDFDEIANHEDIEDEGQTVRVTNPEIGTQATYKYNKASIIDPFERITIQDEVMYNDLIVGKEYTIKGILMDKATGEPLLSKAISDNKLETIDERDILDNVSELVETTSELTFTPETSEGSVVLEFVFNANDLNGKDIVVYEKLFIANEDEELEEIASHEDIEDEGQTVKITDPNIDTKATINGAKETLNIKIANIQDKVMYTDLIAGNKYIIKGVLMDKNSNEVLLVDNEEVTSELTFIAETSEGSALIDFLIEDNKNLENKDIVVFEKVFAFNEDGTLEEIASHEDIEDEDQTVRIIMDLPQTGAGFPINILGMILLALALAIKGYSAYELNQERKSNLTQ